MTLPIPRYLYAMHEAGGEFLFADKKGWIIFTEEIGHDANDRSGKDFEPWANQGYGIIVRVNHGYGKVGTIPLSQHYADFARRFANYVAASPGCSRWIVGNEPNHPQEWPQDEGTGTRSVIQEWQYADCFNQVAAAVHALPGHGQDEIIAAAIAPWTDKAGDWIAYGATMLGLLQGCGGIAIHTYTHGASPELITSERKMGTPYQDRRFEFRAYQDTLNLTVPESMKPLPVYLTEINQIVTDASGNVIGWLDVNNGWVQAAYGEIDGWNQRMGTQKIYCGGALFRWNREDKLWDISTKTGIHNMMRDAVSRGYEVPKIISGGSGGSTVFIPSAGTGQPSTPPPTTPLLPVEWDDRLTKRGIVLTQYQPQPGEWYWRITKGQYWEEKEHIFAVTVDQFGVRKPSVPVRFWWADGKTDKVTELKPNDRWMVDFDMHAHSCSYGFKVLDGPSDSVWCMGLGSWQQPDWNIHVSYWYEVQWTQAPAASVPVTPPPASEENSLAKARFKLGDTVYTGGYVNLRRTPGYVGKSASDIIRTIEPGTQIHLASGPRLIDGLIWWGTSGELGGWMAENDPQGSVLLGSAPPSGTQGGDVPMLTHPIADGSLRQVTQPFGVNEEVYKKFLYDGVPLLGHNGVDFGIPIGTEIRSADKGRVLQIKDEDTQGFGLHLLVAHAWGDSLYAHLSQIVMAEGQEVNAGQVIALSGNTGNSTGPHLHFGIRKKGYNRKDGYGGYSDPLPYLSPVPVSDLNIKIMADQAADEFDIDPDLFLNLLYAENRFRLSGMSAKGAVGPAQIMPATWNEWSARIGVKNINNPADNIRVGAAYLAWLLKQFNGNTLKALYGYNWGIGHVQAGDTVPQPTMIYAYSIIHGMELLKALRKL